MKKTKTIMFGNVNGSYSNKFNRCAKLHAMSSSIKDKMDSFLKIDAVTHRSTCALATKLLLMTGIRIGNEDSAEGYVSKRSDALGRTIQTFGLTTLRKKHFTFRNGLCYITFVGKREVKQTYKIGDAMLIRQIKKVMNSSESDLFLNVTDYDLRKFIQKSVGRNFSPKDFRTLYANVMASDMHLQLMKDSRPLTKTELNNEINIICDYVALQLGNTRGVCKKSYINSELFEYHADKRYYNN